MDSSEYRRFRVVIAEDDDEMRALMTELVIGLDVDVAEASSGSELIVMLTDGRPVDLIITDVRMPWITGYQAALSVRNSGISIPIIIVTAFPDDDLRASIASLGAAVLLPKPFGSEDLLSLVRERLAS